MPTTMLCLKGENQEECGEVEAMIWSLCIFLTYLVYIFALNFLIVIVITSFQDFTKEDLSQAILKRKSEIILLHH